jgi:hypothetical protein
LGSHTVEQQHFENRIQDSNLQDVYNSYNKFLNFVLFYLLIIQLGISSQTILLLLDRIRSIELKMNGILKFIVHTVAVNKAFIIKVKFIANILYN